jgi:hypothetical protein
MSESKDKIWQLRKSFLEAEAQDETAAALLKMKDAAVTPSLSNEQGDSMENEQELITPDNMLEANKEQHEQAKIGQESENKHNSFDDTLDMAKPESKSTPDLGQDSTDVIALSTTQERTSQSQPLLNGISKNGSLKEKLNIAVSQTSVWSQGERKEGSIISFHTIDYKVKIPAAKSRCGCGKKEDKYILQDIR